MKKYMLLAMLTLLNISCNGQNNKGNGKTEDKSVKKPKGSWKVDKEFDENGNLIRYDSTYSWSSENKFDKLSAFDRDCLMQSFKSRFFTNFKNFENQGFEDVFSKDSLFSNHFFNDDFFGSSFGKDFMNIDKIRHEMMKRQKKFLKKYQSEFKNPEIENN